MLPAIVQLVGTCSLLELLPLPLPPLAQLGPNVRLDPRTNILLFSVVLILGIAYIVGRTLRRQPESTASPAVVQTFNQRVLAWWLMFGILITGFLFGYVFSVVLFGLVSFWALREFITMTPTRRGDHRTLFLTFFLFTPAQYIVVGMGREFYGLYTVMIPVYASLLIPALMAMSDDPKRFLERAAKIQAGLMICVYCLSHAPAILDLDLKLSRGGLPWFIAPGVRGSNASVLFFFILMVQLNDVFQYMWSQLRGQHVIAPQINASRTWEGLVGGVLSTTAVGMLLLWATPFSYWAGPIAGVVSLAGFAGSMTMSGIKRDRNVKDYGTLVSGHAGVLDRIDSLCFAAPVFFHITRYFFT